MKIGVFIGRFQPVHNIHSKIINYSLSKYDKTVIIIGSSEASFSLRNPFSDDFRKHMITGCIEDKRASTFSIRFLKDSNYNFNQWLKDVHNIVEDEKLTKNDEIFLIGHYKDSGSYWLNHFPQWNLDKIDFEDKLSSTQIRENLFSWCPTDWKDYVPESTIKVINDWKSSRNDLFELAKNELQFITDYKNKWSNAPFPPTFVTVDSIVLCKGHVVIIKRGRNPGKGQYAMPGGFINQNESLKDAAIRELKEETKIDVAKPILENSLKQVKVFDYPYRDPRGRIITHVHQFELNLKELPNIKAADDANDVKWMSFGDIDLGYSHFYSDHYQIIKNILEF